MVIPGDGYNLARAALALHALAVPALELRPLAFQDCRGLLNHRILVRVHVR